MSYDQTGWDQESGRTCHKTLMKHVNSLSIDSLVYVLNDCMEAAKALPEGHKAGHYLDTAHYIGMRSRKLGK